VSEFVHVGECLPESRSTRCEEALHGFTGDPDFFADLDLIVSKNGRNFLFADYPKAIVLSL
jgi:hypothetical protein